MIAFGVDGCRSGWIAACAEGVGAAPELQIFARFDRLVAHVLERGGVCCVDVPIGLHDEARRCDAEARRLLGPGRASSVFTPPSRSALAGRTPEAMRRLNVAATGRSLPAQTLGIVPKIREVDRVMTPALQARVREAHPEVIFAALHAAGRGLADGKKTARGRRARLALLPPAFARAATARPGLGSSAAPDDVVDALAVLTAALRLARGEARRLPPGPEERDERGLAMEIVF